MKSLLPDFEYDIFISYRHNDNLPAQGSGRQAEVGWVSEFVESLKRELISTIKDPVSVYFDTNPHDGLLETHNVDKSLEGKLKCLIFIPILSQTYCDPKSFAWQHEFVAFNKMAREDQFGRDIKLTGGNVTSRILSIKIHDLDAEDKATLENEIGGVLRAIEFIYKEPGVNRPLLSNDSLDKNLNKTIYRNQVNKVANAIKEIISALKNPSTQSTRTTNNPDSYRDQPTTNSAKSKTKFIAAASIILLALIAGYFFYSRSNGDIEPIDAIDKSVAVLPFIDLSEAKDQGWFSDGLTEEILNSLAHINGLNVISRTSSFAFKNKNLRIEVIADSLHVNYIVEGSVRKSNQGLRITAQLIRVNDGFHLWSNTYDRIQTDIFTLQQEIATKIAQSLDISLDPKAMEKMQLAGTGNAEAYLAFLKGKELFDMAHNRVDPFKYLAKANRFFEESSRLDPDFINPYLYHADFYAHFLLRENPIANDTLSDDMALTKMRFDLNAMVEKAKSDSERDYYRLYQIMYSDDWTGMRPAIEKFLGDPNAAKLLSYQSFNLGTLLINLGYDQEVLALTEKILENDPLNEMAQYDLITALLFSGKYDQAIQQADKVGRLNSVHLTIAKLVALYKLGEIREANEMLSMAASDSTAVFYKEMKVLLGAKKENEVRKYSKSEIFGLHLLFTIHEAYGREAANLKAAYLDKKKILDFPLFSTFFLEGKKLPFDLTATPNFARKLKQAGPRVQNNK